MAKYVDERKALGEPHPSDRPMLLQAAFTIETVAHLRGLETELLPQADFLRNLHRDLKKVLDDYGAEVAFQIVEEALK
jgi:hypothetical protein